MSGVSVTLSVNDLLRRKQPNELQPGVQITKSAGFLRGRYVGKKNNVFGTDVQQVLQRLSRLETMRSVCKTKPCDVTADHAEHRAESAAAKVAKRHLGMTTIEVEQ